MPTKKKTDNSATTVEEEILSHLTWSPAKRKAINKLINKYGIYPIDVMLIGPKGCGKSSLINNLLNEKLQSCDEQNIPNTSTITGYKPCEGITVWDTPGFSVNHAQDKFILNSLIYWLGHKSYKDSGYGFRRAIDMVIIIIDGRSFDLSPTIKILNDLSQTTYPGKIILGINFIDQYAGGKGWDNKKNKPSKQLQFHINHIEQAIINKLFMQTRILVDDFVSFSTLKSYNTNKIISLIQSHFDQTKE